VVATQVSLEPHKWRDVLKKDGQIDVNLMLTNVNTLMRPDLIVGLEPISVDDPPGAGARRLQAVQQERVGGHVLR
jgi:hypothetical protein